MPVGIERANDDLLSIARLERSGRRINFQSRHPWVIRAGTRSAGGDPLGKYLVVQAALFDALPAAVPDLVRRLFDEKTVRRIARHDPAAAGLVSQDVVIPEWIEAAQRQLEPALARGSSVAGAAVAGGLREDTRDMVAGAPDA